MLTTRRLAIAILFLGLFAMAVRVSAGADTWWHLRAGQWMLENRAVLTVDVFSHTRAGAPWINHSWLSQLPLFLVWDALGFAGLNLLVAAVVVGTFAVVYRTCAGGSYLRAFVVILAAAASAVFWSARPQLASLLLTAVFAWALQRFRRGAQNRLWLLVPLMALWVNLHGGFAIGFVLLALTLLGELVSLVLALLGVETGHEEFNAKHVLSRAEGAQRRKGARGLINSFLASLPLRVCPLRAVRRDDALSSSGSAIDRLVSRSADRLGLPQSVAVRTRWRRAGWIALAGLACAAVVPLNPFGARMLLYPFETVSIGVLQDFIQEWQSPNFHLISNQVFLWLLFATLGAVGFSRRKLAPTDFVLLAGFGLLAFAAGRNIAVFAVVTAPILALHADEIVSDVQRRFPLLRLDETAPRRRLRALNGLLLAVIGGAALVKISVPLSTETNAAALADFQPVDAAAYLQRNATPRELFNSYNWGGYLIWSLYPDTPVFVDGRTDLYDDEFLRAYLETAVARPGWQETLREHDIGVVLIESDSFLAHALTETAAWEEQYRDDRAVIFTRAEP